MGVSTGACLSEGWRLFLVKLPMPLFHMTLALGDLRKLQQQTLKARYTILLHSVPDILSAHCMFF